MKVYALFLLGLLAACNNSGDTPKKAHPLDHTEAEPPKDTNRLEAPADTTASLPAKSPQKAYANQRFKEVRVKKVAANSYRVTGKAQVFEARFGWVVNDGRRELASGFESTDAGAPAWGHFSFAVRTPQNPQQPTLVLFESSAKDGSRLSELMVPLS